MLVPRLLGMPLVLSAVLAIAGCGSSVGTGIPPWAGGMPPDAPARAAVPAPYPNVYDIPPGRPTKLISESEQARIEAELAAIRSRVSAQANALEKEQTGEKKRTGGSR